MEAVFPPTVVENDGQLGPGRVVVGRLHSQGPFSEFNGAGIFMDELLMFERPLTSEQVTDLYDYGANFGQK